MGISKDYIDYLKELLKKLKPAPVVAPVAPVPVVVNENVDPVADRTNVNPVVERAPALNVAPFGLNVNPVELNVNPALNVAPPVAAKAPVELNVAPAGFNVNPVAAKDIAVRTNIDPVGANVDPANNNYELDPNYDLVKYIKDKITNFNELYETNLEDIGTNITHATEEFTKFLDEKNIDDEIITKALADNDNDTNVIIQAKIDKIFDTSNTEDINFNQCEADNANCITLIEHFKKIIELKTQVKVQKANVGQKVEANVDYLPNNAGNTSKRGTKGEYIEVNTNNQLIEQIKKKLAVFKKTYDTNTESNIDNITVDINTENLKVFTDFETFLSTIDDDIVENAIDDNVIVNVFDINHTEPIEYRICIDTNAQCLELQKYFKAIERIKLGYLQTKDNVNQLIKHLEALSTRITEKKTYTKWEDKNKQINRFIEFLKQQNISDNFLLDILEQENVDKLLAQTFDWDDNEFLDLMNIKFKKDAVFASKCTQLLPFIIN